MILAAPSGTGKTTLCSRLLSDIPELSLSISTTSRAPRGLEKHGSEYFFVSQAEFEASIKNHQFAEWAKVHGNFYGTAKSTIDQVFKKGQAVLLDIDVQGAESLKKSYPHDTFTIFIHPPSLEALEARLRGRGTDSEATIQKRLKNARDEIAEASKFDLEIVNDDLEQCYEELKAAVTAALFWPEAHPGQSRGNS